MFCYWCDFCFGGLGVLIAGVSLWFIVLSGVLFAGAVGVWCWVYLVSRRLHLPVGDVGYSDLDAEGKVLFSRRYLLTGKPDFLIKTDGGAVPVEYKSGRYISPPLHHVLQLAAYCLLLEDVSGRLVPFGWVMYPSGRFRIDFDSRARIQLTSVMGEMRRILRGEQRVSGCADPGRCRGCSFRDYCPVFSDDNV